MDNKYYVVDVETTVNNTDKDRKKCGLATPFDDNNRIVAIGIKTADVIAPILFYEQEDGMEFVRLRRTGKLLAGAEKPKGYQDHKQKEWCDDYIKSVVKCPIVVGHNISFDICHILKNTAMNPYVEELRKGILENKIVVWDTMLVEYILSGQSWRYPSLNGVCEKYELAVKNDEVKALWDSGCKTEDIPSDMLLEYLEHDVEVTEKIFKKQLARVNAEELKSIVFDELRARMATIIAEYNGMAFDEVHAWRLHKKLDGEIEYMESQLVDTIFKHNKITRYSKEFEDSINFGSHDQVSAMLFGGVLKWKEAKIVNDENGDIVVYKSGLKKGAIKYKNMEFTKELKGMFVPKEEWKSKKVGVFYTSDEVLLELHPERNRVVSLIQDHREARKERDTYLTGLTKVCWADGLLHPTFNHVETPTGRLSCRNPNLQNITAKG